MGVWGNLIGSQYFCKLYKWGIGMSPDPSSWSEGAATPDYCLIAHLCGGRQNNHFICLNKEARGDIRWWQVFSRLWIGVAILPTARQVVLLTSDVSVSWGCSAYMCSQQKWFNLPWPAECINTDIIFKQWRCGAIHGGAIMCTVDAITRRWLTF